jgi:hypothetical protein
VPKQARGLATNLPSQIDLFYVPVKKGDSSEVSSLGTSILLRCLTVVSSGHIIFGFKYIGAYNL